MEYVYYGKPMHEFQEPFDTTGGHWEDKCLLYQCLWLTTTLENCSAKVLESYQCSTPDFTAKYCFELPE